MCFSWSHQNRDGGRGVCLRCWRCARAKRVERVGWPCCHPRPSSAGGSRNPEPSGGQGGGEVQDGPAHRAGRRRRHRAEAAEVPTLRRHDQHSCTHDAEGPGGRAAVWRGGEAGAPGMGALEEARADRDEGEGSRHDLPPGPRQPAAPQAYSAALQAFDTATHLHEQASGLQRSSGFQGDGRSSDLHKFPALGGISFKYRPEGQPE
mmetsp:Transcript_3914/g.8861  ORF Transcript_3914/g.8861 Transcript_3914/m.8861 type:complete len:206 (-) Transcript_3914:540-1157(-)